MVCWLCLLVFCLLLVVNVCLGFVSCFADILCWFDCVCGGCLFLTGFCAVNYDCVIVVFSAVWFVICGNVFVC